MHCIYVVETETSCLDLQNIKVSPPHKQHLEEIVRDFYKLEKDWKIGPTKRKNLRGLFYKDRVRNDHLIYNECPLCRFSVKYIVNGHLDVLQQRP